MSLIMIYHDYKVFLHYQLIKNYSKYNYYKKNHFQLYDNL